FHFAGADARRRCLIVGIVVPDSGAYACGSLAAEVGHLERAHFCVHLASAGAGLAAGYAATGKLGRREEYILANDCSRRTYGHTSLVRLAAIGQNIASPHFSCGIIE